MAVIRLVLAVVLAVAFLGTAAPVLEDARQRTAESAATTTVERLRAAARRLQRSSDPASGNFVAVRTVTVALPDSGVGSSGVRWLAIGGVPGRAGPREPNGTDLIAFHVAGETHVVWVSGLEFRIGTGPESSGDTRALVVRGQARIRLSYRRSPAGPVVQVTAERL
ncbi:MAG: hypothetical protein ABEJ35_07070 [Halobacteriaceae archaeon]